ncbi:MAG: condensation domain-containing protein, partial [Anaerovoracaceae bacterium]
MKTYPLSQSQLGIYLEDIQHPESMQYNLPRYFHFSKNTDTEKLKRAILSVMDTYPVFHTRLITQNGELRQYPDYDLRIDIPVIQVAEEEVEQRISQFIRPFDFQKDALSRFLLIETPKSLYLVCDIHHIILDGSNYQLLADYISLAYNGESLPKEQISLHEYAEQEELTFRTSAYEQAATHYKEKFENVAMTKLSQKNNNEGYVIRRSAFVSKELINDFCVKEGVKPSWLFMAAFSITLSKFTREETIAYTTINHGRHDKSLLKSFGMFVKTVPILTKIDKRQSVIDFIKSHQEELASTRSYGVYPFSHLCQQIGIKPELTFGFQGSQVKEEYSFLGENVKMDRLLGSGLSTQNPSILIYETTTEYDIRLKYVESQYEDGYMQQFADAMATCVEQLVASPNKLLKDISIVSDAEQQKL